MNEDTTTTPPTSKKRTRKAAKPRAPRVIPPEEQAIRDAAKKQIEEYRQGLKSGDVLKRIRHLIPKLTNEHYTILQAHVSLPRNPNA